MKNPLSRASLCLPTLFVLAVILLLASSARAGLNLPYAVDANTLHLWHFDDTVQLSSYQTETDAVVSADISVSLTLTNYGLGVSSTGTGTAGNPPFTNIVLTNISPAPGVAQCLDILPDNGVPNGTGASYAMAAGAQSVSATNFCNPTTGAFTFEALVNPRGNIFSSGAGTGEWEIFCGDSGASSRGWQFRLQNGAAPSMDFNFLAFYSGETGGNWAIPLPASGPDQLYTNQWYHVAVTYTGFAPTNTDTAGVVTYYWTLLAPTRTNADVLFTTNLASPGSIGAAAPYPAVGGSQRTTHGVGNEGSFQGFITEVRVSQVARYATNMAFNSAVVGLPPTISQEPPAAEFIGYGQTLALSPLISGSPSPSFQWQQTNTGAGGWSNLTGQTNSDLTISNATFAAAGTYRLVASNNIDGFSYVTNTTASVVTIGAAFSEAFNTGTDSNDVANTALAGDADLHYTLIDSADAINLGPDTVVWDMNSFPIASDGGGFANPDGVSQWIGPTWNNGGAGYTSPQGSYIYRTHILADSVDTTKPAAVHGTWWANTTGADILLNGVSLDISTGVTNAGTVPALFTITNGFVPGLNTLDFVVPCVNPNGSYPESAVRVEFSSVLGQALPAGLPQILTQPTTNETVSDSSVVPGTSASFSVVAIGRPPLSYQWVDEQTGPIVGATNRTLSFSSPMAGAQGTNFAVVISNASGSITSSIATLTVVETNQPPLAPDVTYSVYTNNSLNIDLSELLLGAADPNNLPLTINYDVNSTNGASITENVANGSVITYTPNLGFVGQDEFNYYITDSAGLQSTGRVLINVLPQNLPPAIHASHVGNNLIFSGSGGAPGGPYDILTTTNLTLPLSSWTVFESKNFDNTGAFSVSVPITVTNLGQYYTIELP